MPALNRTGKDAVMNPALPDIEPNFGPKHADPFSGDLHASIRADGSMSFTQSGEGDPAQRDRALIN